ncbi:class A beta-lactamase-related serine hydrolase [bacterium]|nr:class A beta-lactamase-related serine hydrolase [bacterium]
MKSRIQQIAKQANCDISLFFARLDNPIYNLEINSHTPFPIASTFKLNLLIAAIQRCNSLIVKDSCLLTLRNYHKVPGSSLSECEPGTKFTLKYLLEVMMSKSDNTATDILCDFLSLESVLKEMPSWGISTTEFLSPTKVMIHLLTNLWPRLEGKTVAEQIQLWKNCSPSEKMAIIEESYSCLRDIPLSEIQSAADSYYDSLPIEEGKALVQSLGWSGTTHEYGNLILRILDRTLINKQVSDTVRDYLKLGGKGLIGINLEKYSNSPTCQVGRKGGSDEGVRCDTGYLSYENGKTAVISVFVKELSSEDDTDDKLEAVISEVCDLLLSKCL